MTEYERMTKEINKYEKQLKEIKEESLKLRNKCECDIQEKEKEIKERNNDIIDNTEYINLLRARKHHCKCGGVGVCTSQEIHTPSWASESSSGHYTCTKCGKIYEVWYR